MPDRPRNDVTPSPVPPLPQAPRPLSDIQPHVAPTPQSPAPDVTPAPSPDDLTADALRHSLDRGRGGDKTDFSDPAAAPLGTDDEAAGFRPRANRSAWRPPPSLAPVRPKTRARAAPFPNAPTAGWACGPSCCWRF